MFIWNLTGRFKFLLVVAVLIILAVISLISYGLNLLFKQQNVEGGIGTLFGALLLLLPVYTPKWFLRFCAPPSDEVP